MSQTTDKQIEGYCPAQLQPMADAFARNVFAYGDDGASCALYVAGEPVLHLWAGSRDRAQQLPWQADTLANVFSAAKAVVAWAILDLHARGRLDLDAPIAELWPEFGEHGKHAISTRHVLAHRAGVPALRQPVAESLIYDWQLVMRQLEQEAPAWEPGTAQGYHVFTFGWILGEIVARVSGEAVADYIEQYLCQPHAIDLCFGLADQQMCRVADIESYRRPDQDAAAARKSASQSRSQATGKRERPRPQWRDSLLFQAFHNPPTLSYGTNGEAWRRAVIPGGNGHATGESLARFYGLLVAGETLLPAATRQLCLQELSAEKDRVIGVPGRFSHGFMLPREGGMFFPHTDFAGFGHTGTGGSTAFADTERQLGFSYVTRHISKGRVGDRRSSKIVAALYDSIEGLL